LRFSKENQEKYLAKRKVLENEQKGRTFYIKQTKTTRDNKGKNTVNVKTEKIEM